MEQAGEKMKEYHTKNKDLIKEYMTLHGEERFCANEIYQYLLDCGKKTNLTTVYRNLDKMTQAGELAKVKHPSDDSTYYQVVDSKRHCQDHLHLRCLKCGKVVHLEDDYMQEFYAYVEKQTGFTLECMASQLNGMCKGCMERGIS